MININGVEIELDIERTAEFHRDWKHFTYSDLPQISRIRHAPPEQDEILRSLDLPLQRCTAWKPMDADRGRQTERIETSWSIFGALADGDKTEDQKLDDDNWWRIQRHPGASGQLRIIFSNLIPRLEYGLEDVKNYVSSQACPHCNYGTRWTGLLTPSSPIPEWEDAPEFRAAVEQGERVRVAYCAICAALFLGLEGK